MYFLLQSNLLEMSWREIIVVTSESQMKSLYYRKNTDLLIVKAIGIYCLIYHCVLKSLRMAEYNELYGRPLLKFAFFSTSDRGQD